MAAEPSVTLSPAELRRFLAALDKPFRPNTRLKRAMQRGVALGAGLPGCGISLVLFVLTLRGVGSTRTGAYFATAPFTGAAIAILAFGDHASWMFWLAAVLMGAGVWSHLTERREHLVGSKKATNSRPERLTP